MNLYYICGPEDAWATGWLDVALWKSARVCELRFTNTVQAASVFVVLVTRPTLKLIILFGCRILYYKRYFGRNLSHFMAKPLGQDIVLLDWVHLLKQENVFKSFWMFRCFSVRGFSIFRACFFVLIQLIVEHWNCTHTHFAIINFTFFKNNHTSTYNCKKIAVV